MTKTGFMKYRPGTSDEINVLYWVKWPSYDFIFGVPSSRNKHEGQEVGFFQYRDIRLKKVQSGFYVDAIELRELVKGFKLIQKWIDKS